MGADVFDGFVEGFGIGIVGRHNYRTLHVAEVRFAHIVALDVRQRAKQYLGIGGNVQRAPNAVALPDWHKEVLGFARGVVGG